MESNKPNSTALSQAQGIFSRFNSLTTPQNIYQVPDAQGTDSSKFPARIGSTDPDDQKYMLRQQLVQNGVVPGVGTPIVGDEFFSYAKRKQDQALLYDFQTWVMKQSNLQTPESAAWWFEKFPWMKELRVGEIEREAEVQKKIATINITGPQSQDDFMILFMLKQGLLKPSNVPLYQMNGSPKTVGVAPDNSFTKGVFNPFGPSYPQTMDTSMVPFSNPAPSFPITNWTGAAQNTPVATTGNANLFGIGNMLNAGGTWGVPATTTTTST